MSIKKIILFFLLAPFTLFTSCIDADKTVGGGFLTEDYQLNIEKQVFNLPIISKMPDSIQAYSASSLIFGYLNDPRFGNSSVGSTSFIRSLTDTTDFGDNPTFKRAYITMSIDSTFTTKKDQEGIAQNIYIYKLIRDLDSTKFFNTSFTSADYDPIPISVGTNTFFGGDSLRIELSESFGKELLSITKSEIDTFDLFKKKIKGFYITTDSPNVNISSGRLNYMSLTSSFITVDYIHKHPTKGDRDSSKSFILGYNYALNFFKPGSKALATERPSSELFLDGLAGVKPYVKGSDIMGMIDTWAEAKGIKDVSKIILSRAYLEFPYEVPVDSDDMNSFPNLLYPCYQNSSKDSVQYFYPLGEIYKAVNIGAINRSLSTYTCDITRYMQTLLKSKSVSEKSNNLWLMPILKYSDSYGNVYYNFDNAKYSKIVLNGMTANRKPTLVMVYAVMNH